jgi:hypothetical protein
MQDVGTFLWRGEPPVAPRTPSLWAVGIHRCALFVGSQGGTAPSAIQLPDH